MAISGTSSSELMNDGFTPLDPETYEPVPNPGSDATKYDWDAGPISANGSHAVVTWDGENHQWAGSGVLDKNRVFTPDGDDTRNYWIPTDTGNQQTLNSLGRYIESHRGAGNPQLTDAGKWQVNWDTAHQNVVSIVRWDGLVLKPDSPQILGGLTSIFNDEGVPKPIES